MPRLPSRLNKPAVITAAVLAVSAVLGAAAALTLAGPRDATAAAAAAAPAKLDTVTLGSTAADDLRSVDGVVEAVRQSVLAAQVAGAVVELRVQPGDRVKAGQVLLRLDAQAAQQTAAASAAQVQAAHAQRDAATREFERQKALFAQNYISQAALDRAETQYRAARAEADALLAAAGATRSQSEFYVIRAAYDGVVAEVPVVLGDMALPGRPLVTVYDPARLRISARVPSGMAAQLRGDAVLTAQVGGEAIRLSRWQLLPAVDAASHTRELRIDLPAGSSQAPGTFARVALPTVAPAGSAPLRVPASAVVRRGETQAVYVVGDDGRPLLRLVRLGASAGADVAVLAGLTAGERVAVDPQAAARVTR